MPKKKTKLQVRLWVWAKGGKNRVKYRVGKRWVACTTLETPRKHAGSHGYSGIQIQPR